MALDPVGGLRLEIPLNTLLTYRRDFEARLAEIETEARLALAEIIGKPSPCERRSRRPVSSPLTLALARTRLVAHVRGAGETTRFPRRESVGLLDARQGPVENLRVHRVG